MTHYLVFDGSVLYDLSNDVLTLKDAMRLMEQSSMQYFEASTLSCAVDGIDYEIVFSRNCCQDWPMIADSELLSCLAEQIPHIEISGSGIKQLHALELREQMEELLGVSVKMEGKNSKFWFTFPSVWHRIEACSVLDLTRFAQAIVTFSNSSAVTAKKLDISAPKSKKAQASANQSRSASASMRLATDAHPKFVLEELPPTEDSFNDLQRLLEEFGQVDVVSEIGDYIEQQRVMHRNMAESEAQRYVSAFFSAENGDDTRQGGDFFSPHTGEIWAAINRLE